MEKLQTKLTVDINGVEVEYGRVPFTLSEEWRGLSFYFATSDCPDYDKHMQTVHEVISKLIEQSFDHWAEWRVDKIENIQCDQYYQETLVKFRVRDSY